MNLDNLNDKQKEAVLYNDGPLLIIAGAGAGKTKTLTTKIAYLIEEGLAAPYNILAITFTNKAAKEMRDRLYLFFIFFFIFVSFLLFIFFFLLFY